MASESWLVVGLGNPGENYRDTRHNVGFRVVESLVLKHGVTLREKDRAIFGSYRSEGREIFLFFPQTFMNESGQAVGPFARYRQIPLERILVVSDDLDLPVGRARLRTSGGSGGHHGLDSLILHLGGNQFPRIRLGVGKPPSPEEGPHHVLSGFKPEEKTLIDEVVARAAEGVEILLKSGPEAAMREINRDTDAAKN